MAHSLPKNYLLMKYGEINLGIFMISGSINYENFAIYVNLLGSYDDQ
jgi:hypothetical protein